MLLLPELKTGPSQHPSSRRKGNSEAQKMSGHLLIALRLCGLGAEHMFTGTTQIYWAFTMPEDKHPPTVSSDRSQVWQVLHAKRSDYKG